VIHDRWFGLVGWPLALELRLGDFGSHEQPRQVVLRELDELPAAKAAVPPYRLVVRVRVGEALVLPEQEPEAVAHCLDEDVRARETRQVRVAGEVVGELRDRHMVTAPERDAVELHAEPGPSEPGQQQLLGPQAL